MVQIRVSLGALRVTMLCTVLLLIKFIATATIQGKMRYVAGSRPAEDAEGLIGQMFLDPKLDAAHQSLVSHNRILYIYLLTSARSRALGPATRLRRSVRPAGSGLCRMTLRISLSG